jgi:cytidylate kinase
MTVADELGGSLQKEECQTGRIYKITFKLKQVLQDLQSKEKASTLQYFSKKFGRQNKAPTKNMKVDQELAQIYEVDFESQASSVQSDPQRNE